MSNSSSYILTQEEFKPHFKNLNKEQQEDFRNYSNGLKHVRDSLSRDLILNLKKIDNNCEELKKALALNIGNVELHYFKHVIKTINDLLDRNDNFLNLKQKELSEKEKQLSDELKLIERKILDTSLGKVNFVKKPIQYKPLDTYHVNLPESICAFDDFLLKHGGHSGGWKPDDHQLFLHLKNKFKIDQVVEIIHEKMPDITPDMVREHNDWHEQYISLLQSKKEAIDEWKTTKLSERSKSVGNINQDVEEAVEIKRKSKSGTHRSSMSDIDVKEQIAQWKIEKAQRLKEEEEYQRKINEKIITEEKLKREAKKLERKKLIEYKETQMKMEFNEKQKREWMKRQEKINKARKANILIQVYRKQDEKKLQEKIEKKKEFVIKELENLERLKRVKSEVKVKRDPNRVQKPTSGWKNKVRNETDELEITQNHVNYISHVSHLKVPEWRQDIKFDDQIIL